MRSITCTRGCTNCNIRVCLSGRHVTGVCVREILRDRVRVCDSTLRTCTQPFASGYKYNVITLELVIYVAMLTSLCKKMSLPAGDLHYIITSKILVHCMEHQYAFFTEHVL